MTDQSTHELGPLATLEGVWEGAHGADVSPDDDRTQIERNAFRERLEFEPTGLVENHEQWDAQAKQVMLSFVVPRGICVLAGA